MKNIKANELCIEIMKGNREENVFLDVRSKEEFQEENIPGVVNIPLSELEENIKQIEPYQNIFVHCAAGGRSQTACSILEKHGFKNVYNVEGGINAWKECHLPTQHKSL